MSAAALATLMGCGTAMDPDGVAMHSQSAAGTSGTSGGECQASAATAPATTTTIHVEVRPAALVSQTPVVQAVPAPVVVHSTPVYAPAYVRTSYAPADDGSTILYVRPARVELPPPVVYAPMRIPARVEPTPITVVPVQVTPE